MIIKIVQFIILNTYNNFLLIFSETNYLGQLSSLNDQLSDVQKRFTYFVPRDTAWKRLSVDNPSVYKKLFMPEFSAVVSIIQIVFIFFNYIVLINEVSKHFISYLYCIML